MHPSRNWGSITPARGAVAGDLARAIPVRPAAGRDAWFSQTKDKTTATLAAPVTGATELSFDLWYDTEGTDLGVLETSADGATWTPAPFSLKAGRSEWTSNGTFSGFEGRRWTRATATLPAGTTSVRWRYTTDPLYEGRGVYVDGVRAADGSGHVVFDGERHADAARFVSDGWVVSRDLRPVLLRDRPQASPGPDPPYGRVRRIRAFPVWITGLGASPGDQRLWCG